MVGIAGVLGAVPGPATRPGKAVGRGAGVVALLRRAVEGWVEAVATLGPSVRDK